MKLNLNKFLPNEFQKSLGSEKGYEKNKYLPGFLQNFALASRHFSMAWREKNLHLGERIGHTFIGIVECIPLLGNLIGIGEKRLFSKNVDNPTTEKTKSVASSILKQSQKTTASINKSATSLSSNKNIAISSTKTTEQTDNSLSETVQQKKRVHWPDEQTSGQNSLRGFNEKEAFKCFLQDYFKEICSEGNRSQIFYEKTTGKKLCDIGADGNLLAITEEGEEFLKNRGIFPSSEQSKELETIYDISPPPNTRTESNSATISTLTEKSELLKSETAKPPKFNPKQITWPENSPLILRRIPPKECMEIFGFEVNSQTSDITKADKPGTQSLKIVPDSKQSDSWTILNINDTPLCTYSSGILTITSKGSDFLKSRKNTIPQQTILKPNSKTNKKYLYSKQESNQILKIKDPKSWLGSTIKVQGGSLQQDGSLSLTGGFGSVFVNDQFAVKHVKPQEDQQNLLEKEIEKAGYVNGLPNVIQTIAVESIEKNGNNGTLILMELATGMELSNWVQENQYRPIETILDIAKKVSTGMNAIHEIGVIHNDIKLENIIFDRKTGKLKIFDFGLSKFDGELCEPKGTRNYLSPEVLKVCYNQGMSKQTTASDVYGFGYLLLELFGQDNLGYSPFINNYKTNYFNNYNANYRMRNDINIDSKFLESQGVSPKNSQKFAEIISNCMKVNPEERWTMQQVLNALNEITL